MIHGLKGQSRHKVSPNFDVLFLSLSACLFSGSEARVKKAGLNLVFYCHFGLCLWQQKDFFQICFSS